MKSFKTPAAVGRILILVALLICSNEAYAFQRPNRSGCEGTVKKGAGTPTAVKEWNVYTWPDASSKVIAKVKGGERLWVYVDYANPFYLVSICAREAGAQCKRDDNIDDNPSNDPKVGFVERGAIDYLKFCHVHAEPSGKHKEASKKYKGGKRYVVRSEELYLRSVENDNGGNHPYGLLRRHDRFIKDKISPDGQWMYGWAQSGSKGVNPQMRYGRVLYKNGQYLRPDN